VKCQAPRESECTCCSLICRTLWPYHNINFVVPDELRGQEHTLQSLLPFLPIAMNLCQPSQTPEELFHPKMNVRCSSKTFA
jgi:hypothetical protein